MNDNMKSSWDETPSFEQTTNFKEFFLRDDALANLNSELVFSIFQRYMCKAKCNMCYLQHEWMNDSHFSEKHVPSEVTPQDEQAIIDAFSYFDVVTSTDDLYLIKNKYPTLYKFYLRHSNKMSSTAMSDNAFIQQFDIIMNEMQFKSIYEVSFSDTFLNKNAGKLADDIISKLQRMTKKLPILKLKLIFREGNGEKNPNVMKLINWAKTNSIYVDVQDDFLTRRNVRYALTQADHQSTNVLSVSGHVHLILCEVVFLQFTSMFLSLSDAVSDEGVPFFDVRYEPLSSPSFVTAMLKAKLKVYANNARYFSKECDGVVEKSNVKKYRDYFMFVSSQVVINDKYTFIPRFMLKPYSSLYQRLANTTFNDTQYGLILRNAQQPVSIVSILNAPKTKLEHIPIKNYKGE